ncbi:hypothetical protein EVA_09810 [gut metagenome]|uniref:Uncharacterized protein n=1 Tax=gut metagenome TaxID=749906 RepID=J9G5G0_9ZZZZ
MREFLLLYKQYEQSLLAGNLCAVLVHCKVHLCIGRSVRFV